MTLPNIPIRYIQEYLALQRVLAPQTSLDHPGEKRGVRTLTARSLHLLSLGSDRLSFQITYDLPF